LPIVLVAVAIVPLAGMPSAPALASARHRAAAKPGDFNGDGIVDVAVGAEGEDVNGTDFAGAVYVFLGSSAGLRTSGALRITQATPGVPGAPLSGGRFGGALAVGDFDRDGHSDLAIGDPEHPVNGKAAVGGVVVIPGSAAGLDPSAAVELDESAFGGAIEAGDRYGSAFAAADFDGNGVADLAIDGMNEGVNGHKAAGAVGVLFGRHGTGLGTQGAELLTQGRLPGQRNLENGFFGRTLSAGDLNGDGIDDLLAQGLDMVNGNRCGAVFRIPGGSGGLVPASAQAIDPSLLPGPGCADEFGGDFGAAMAVGDVAGGPTDDLAIGAAQQDVGNKFEAGAVYVVDGSPSGLTTDGSVRITEASGAVPGEPRRIGSFGGSLATGNFGNGGRTDLAVLAEDQKIDGFLGGTDVFYAGDSGLDLHAQYLSHGTSGVPSPGEIRWATTIFAANVGNGATADLFGGATQDEVSGHPSAGAGYVLYGTSTGVTGAGSLRFSPASPGTPGDPQDSGFFGVSIA
jgi:hypothetical protein